MDERMLRHALMEANLERFRDVLDAAEEPDWSHRYLSCLLYTSPSPRDA